MFQMGIKVSNGSGLMVRVPLPCIKLASTVRDEITGGSLNFPANYCWASNFFFSDSGMPGGGGLGRRMATLTPS